MTTTQLKPTVMAMVCLIVGLASSPTPAAASSILYNDFGPGDTFNANFSYATDGNAGFQAFRFVLTASGALDKITVALGRTGAAQASTVFQLYEGSSTTALGALIESFVVSNSATPDSTSPFTADVVTFGSALMPALIAGQGYWLSFSEPEPSNGASSLWIINSIGANGTRLTDLLPASTQLLPAFRLEASAVPEPGTGLLLMTGLLAARRRHRASVVRSVI
jgi:hypothetical protein